MASVGILALHQLADTADIQVSLVTVATLE